jgi:hypothetical protein
MISNFTRQNRARKIMFRVLEMSRFFQPETDCFIDTMVGLSYFKKEFKRSK